MFWDEKNMTTFGGGLHVDQNFHSKFLRRVFFTNLINLFINEFQKILSKKNPYKKKFEKKTRENFVNEKFKNIGKLLLLKVQNIAILLGPKLNLTTFEGRSLHDL